jgi:ATP-binding protein involved in chromosome partitioning
MKPSTIKYVLAIASGKGGVGKSTVALNLALALAAEGLSVGLLDADIYGPSQPLMMGLQGQKPRIEDKKIHPIEKYGIKTMSVGYLVDNQTAMMWRGPMIGKVMEQMFQDTLWGVLDYLIIDLPPGTGDIQLNLCQKTVLTGALIITTPQTLALSDVKRACEMFKHLNVPLLGVIENMSHYHCTACGHQENIFSEGGGAMLAEMYAAPLLGSLPLNARLREMTDQGCPPMVQLPLSDIAKAFAAIASTLQVSVNQLPKNVARKFPNIVVENKVFKK